MHPRVTSWLLSLHGMIWQGRIMAPSCLSLHGMIWQGRIMPPSCLTLPVTSRQGYIMLMSRHVPRLNAAYLGGYGQHS
jgi:hypothetical protein